jgi:phenylalanyl-tRNA synthetase beta chain
MNVSYKWLSEYLDVSGYTAKELAEKLTRSGIEVDVVEALNKGVSGVVVGHVLTKDKHPDADKLSVLTIDVGGEENLQIVCGAQNVAAGQKVPVAVVGAVLPGDFKIKRAKLRGVESAGMVCSAKELGMNDKLLAKELQEGIFVLPADSPIGADAVALLGLDDEVLELDLTPNRSDALSMLGVAYEIGAIIGREAKLPKETDGQVASGKQATELVKVKVDEPARELCSHYIAKYIEDVKVAPSPLWMQTRLMAAGVRPINNVVDITNYVLMEYGQPLHAFDASILPSASIHVRPAADGEVLATLDGQQRTLDPSMLVIASGKTAVALAGVMGGADTEVDASTTTVVLESAKFHGGSVRKTSRKVGLRSESSIRFEKEVDPARVRLAAERAASLLCQLAGGKVAFGVAEDLVSPAAPKVITITGARINSYIGTDIPLADMQAIFARLQFEVKVIGDDTLEVTVPTRRGDISRDVDLIEEVARIYGYDHIPATPILGATTPGALTRGQKVRRLVRESLVGSGLYEAVNYSFTDPKVADWFKGFYPTVERIPLALPMSEERSVLRTSLVPHLIENAIYNNNRNTTTTAVFEIGNIFVANALPLADLPEERTLVAGLWTGLRRATAWHSDNAKVDFFDVKGVVDALLGGLGIGSIAAPVSYVRLAVDGSDSADLHPGRSAAIVTADGVRLGWIGQLHPSLQQQLDLDDTYVFELDLAALVDASTTDIAYTALPRFPATTRDLAVAVALDAPVGEMLRVARAAAGELVESLELFDVYTGDKVDAGTKSVAMSFVYRHPERTLTDDEVSEAHARAVEALTSTFAAILR